jgi:hypothetical protein
MKFEFAVGILFFWNLVKLLFHYENKLGFCLRLFDKHTGCGEFLSIIL